MGFIGITSEPLEIVSHTAVDVAVERNTHLPITFAVLVATVLVVFGDFQHCRVQVSVLNVGKLFDRFHKEHFVTSANIFVNVGENCVATDLTNDTEGEKVTTPLPLCNVSDCPGRKLSAVSTIFQFHAVSSL